MRRFWFALLVPVLGCTGRPAGDMAADAVPRADARDTESASFAPDAAPDLQHAWQDSTCQTDTVFAHKDPAALLSEYVARNDSLGFFAGGGDENEAWYFAAIECPGHLGGSDIIGVVMRYRSETLSAGTDSARYVVQYQLAGEVSADTTGTLRFTLKPVSASDSVLLVRTPYGWRISGQPVGVFMAPGAVARQVPLPTEDRERLDSLARVRATNARRGD